ncbi:c-type cytochrome [Massilia sp. GCM10023247]|uniref:c-type cytochrome n=1 Tax=Massilia sp. GCM10023247 TaxID=3252643 RepID=UPI00360F00AC
MRNQFVCSVFPLVRRLGALGLCVALAGCGEREAAAVVAGGDPAQGQRLMAQYQCTACHAIPEVPGAAGNAGPPLERFGRRSYIAGGIPNTPANLARWLDNPQAMKPGTAMPDLGVSPGEARHMAAYLATLQ